MSDGAMVAGLPDGGIQYWAMSFTNTRLPCAWVSMVSHPKSG